MFWYYVADFICCFGLRILNGLCFRQCGFHHFLFFSYTGWDDILHRMTKTYDCIKCDHRLQWWLILMKFHCLSMATSNLAMGNILVYLDNMNFNFISWNCHGMRSRKKRRSNFDFMKKNHFLVVCLQEIYITSSDVEMWKKRVGRGICFTPGTCHSNGLITLINSKWKVDKAASVILQDRILPVYLSLEGQDVTIFYVYGPNAVKNKLNFIKELQKHIEEVPSSHKLVVSADFNMVLSNRLDIISGCPHDSKIVSVFNGLLCKTDLYDIWRIYNPTCEEFSWSSSYSPWKARRIDYIIINSCLCDNVVSCDIIPVPNTDHCGLTLNVSLGKIKRGPSYWKFNQSLLKDTEYVKLLTNKINISKNALESFPSYLKWDYCKNELKGYPIIYNKQKAK